MVGSIKFRNAVAFGALTLGLGWASARAEDKITIGFVTHAQGNPFVQQIVDGSDVDVMLDLYHGSGRSAAAAAMKGAATDVPVRYWPSASGAGAQIRTPGAEKAM